MYVCRENDTRVSSYTPRNASWAASRFALHQWFIYHRSVKTLYRHSVQISLTHNVILSEKGKCDSNLVISMGNMIIHQGIFGVLCLQTNPCTFFLVYLGDMQFPLAWRVEILYRSKNQSKISAAQMVLARSCENCDKLLQTMGTQQNYHLHFWMEYTIHRSVCAWVSHIESLHCRSPKQPGVQAAGAQSPPGSALPRYHRKVCHCGNCMSQCTKHNQHVQVWTW